MAEAGLSTAAPGPVAVSADERFTYIDGLRGIAALLVFSQHFLSIFVRAGTGGIGVGEALDWVQRTLDFGRMGVDLFFVISGFVIGESLCRYRSDNVRMFVVARFFRLFPIYWVSIVAAMFLYTRGITPTRVLVNFTMLQDFFGVAPMIGVYWTLTIELVFYAACIVLFQLGLLDRARPLGWCAAALVGAALLAAIVRYATNIPVPYTWPMFLSLFIGGMLLRKLDDQGRAQGGTYWALIAGYLVATLVVAVTIYHDPARYQKTWIAEFGSTAVAVATFALVLRFKPRLRTLALVGIVSYSFYLFHAPLGEALIRLRGFDRLIQATPWPVGFLVLTALVLAFSAATYWLIERPAIGCGRHVRRRLAARPATAAPLRT